MLPSVPAPAPVSPALFADHRPYLFGIAYRMLGSAAEAEDVLQEAYLRVHASAEPVRAPAAYLATVVTRLCLDVLKSARARRESYVGTWLPEPVLTEQIAGPAPASPSARMDSVESISLAFLVLLEALSPLERAALVLRDVFDWDFEAIAAALERTPAACRQLVHRGRQHLAARTPRFRATEAERQRLFEAFLAAIQADDADALATMLSTDAVAISDSGGKARAARNTVEGRDRVSKLLRGLARKGGAGGFSEIRFASLNGGPALLGWEGGRLTTVVSIDPSPAGIDRVWFLRNPDKLAHLAAQLDRADG